MLDAAVSIQAVLVLTGLLSAAMFVFAGRSRSQYVALPELKQAADAVSQDHCVIIPARNEEAVIGRCIGSFPETLTVVIDDHSTDRTVERAREAGADVRPAQTLHRRWLGKPNACWSGALYTSSDWILFVDADTWYDPDFLPTLLAHAARENLAAVSVFPSRKCFTWWERTLLPYAFGLYFTGVNARAVNDPRDPEALANGQCLLFRRKSYEFLGGHKSVAGSVMEDLALARLLKRHRMSGRVMRCESMAHVRMYDSFGALWRGFEKNASRLPQVNPRRALLVAAASIVMTSWLPVLLLLAYLRVWAAAALFFIVPAMAWRPWYGSWRYAMLAPFAIYVFQVIAVSALVKGLLGLTTDWKGRRV
jgi:glycosyltransferase involved in cell wall biosynthesis